MKEKLNKWFIYIKQNIFKWRTLVILLHLFYVVSISYILIDYYVFKDRGKTVMMGNFNNIDSLKLRGDNHENLLKILWENVMRGSL